MWSRFSMLRASFRPSIRFLCFEGENVKHIVCFSGGKDSTALVLWARENLGEFETVFCDTGWEHPITYAYVEEINRTVLNGSLVTLNSAKYSGFVDLCVLKGRAPSACARFCTDALKVRPMIAHLKTIDDEVTVYQGIRADESASRSRMAIEQWDDNFDALIKRPLLYWTAAQCFEIMRREGVEPNPLYLLGAGRVGCFPCVMINHRELKVLLANPELGPYLRKRILDLEALVGRSFFEPTYIPQRFCTGFDEVSGKRFAWAQDVFSYLEESPIEQFQLLPPRTCMSVYNLCE
jgi:3'-phosphoadenosine 5'-phosphosulfate sulfotransferase (PAPS reductase)/FAD synthetase